jgi:cell division GTPase FtsZ
MMSNVIFQNGVSADEYRKVMEGLTNQEDRFISMDPEEIGRVLADHEETLFGRIDFRRTKEEVALSDVPEWLKESVSECDRVFLFITGDLSLLEAHNAVETVKALLPEKADIVFCFRQSDSSDIEVYALVA